MKRRYQKQIAELGFIRCLNCGQFSLATIDTFKVERTFLSIPLYTIDQGFLLKCSHCQHEKLISQEEVNDLIHQSQNRLPVHIQQSLWKRIYRAHKRLAKKQEGEEMQLQPFFNEVKNEVLIDLPYDIEKKDINYIFNAYLTNLTIASKKD